MDKKYARYSIKNLTQKMNRPPAPTGQCMYLVKASKLIKDTTGDGESRTDTYWHCSKQGKRISKRSCAHCQLYLRAVN